MREALLGEENREIGRITRPIPRNVVARPRLFARFDEARDVGVCLVCAPAGYGKSLAVASWLAERGVPAAAWANLSAAGTSAARAWTAVAEAFSSVAAPETAEELHEITALAAVAPAEAPARLAEWVRGGAAPEFLVLDDLQAVLAPETHEQIVEFVAAVTGRLRVVAIARHDPPWPLHRMRLEGRLRDVRTTDIAFQPDEATQLFDILGVPLAADDVSRMVERTEGWAAGLRLAALGLSGSTDPHGFVLSMSGRSGYIADYLMREVYDELPARWQDFLRRVSVVDEVCPELAEALGGGGGSADLLAELARQNAFVVELDERLGWYRLHPLLLDFVRSRATNRRQQTQLNHQAAQWFRGQNANWLALRHALRAQDWPLAAELVGAHVVTWTARRPPTELLETLNALPQEALLTYPGLAIGAAAAKSMAGQPDGVDELVAAATSQLHRTSGRRRRRYELLVQLIDAGSERWNGNLESLMSGLRRIPVDPAVLSSIGLSDWAAIRTLVVGNLGTCALWTGDRDQARTHLEHAAAEDLGPQIVLPILNAKAHLAYLYWVDGELVRAEEAAKGALSGLNRAGMLDAVQVSAAYLALAGVALDRDQVADAQRWLDVLGPTPPEPHIALSVAMMRARALIARGSLYEASTRLSAEIEAIGQLPLPAPLVMRARRLEEEIDALVTKAAAVEEVAADAAAIPPDTQSVRSRVHRHLSAVTGRAREEQARLQSLEAACELAAPQNLILPFLDRQVTIRPLLPRLMERGVVHPEFAVGLLTRMSAGDKRVRRPGMFIPLTGREMNILRHLATSMSAVEIADALYVSINTVKTHQRAVYQKLGANSRRDAVNHARELGLL